MKRLLERLAATWAELWADGQSTRELMEEATRQAQMDLADAWLESRYRRIHAPNGVGCTAECRAPSHIKRVVQR